MRTLIAAALCAALMAAQQASASKIDEMCEAGNSSSCLAAGCGYEHGDKVVQDLPKAFDMYTRGCALNSAESCFRLGLMLYHEGRCQRAASAWESACKLNYSVACTNLGFLHDLGKGVKADPKAAASYYRKACELGEGKGCGDLGNLFHDGSIGKDLKEAARFYGRACTLNDYNGCILLGGMYGKGEGVRKSQILADEYAHKGSHTSKTPAGDRERAAAGGIEK